MTSVLTTTLETTEKKRLEGLVAHGDMDVSSGDELVATELGRAVLANGRVSIARRECPEVPQLPFTSTELARLDEALTVSSRVTGLHFSVYLGNLDDDTRAHATKLHDQVNSAENAVLIAVSPGQRALEIVTGAATTERLPDRACKLAVMSMIAFFKEGDLIGGLVSGLRMLTDQAGPDHLL